MGVTVKSGGQRLDRFHAIRAAFLDAGRVDLGVGLAGGVFGDREPDLHWRTGFTPAPADAPIIARAVAVTAGVD